MTSVIVVGAGIVGASIAHHLSRAGHTVTVVEQGEAGANVTAASFSLRQSAHGSQQTTHPATARSEPLSVMKLATATM